MKIIKPSVEFFGAVPTDYAGTLAFIEKAGRLCYKSEDKITADAAEWAHIKKLRTHPSAHPDMVRLTSMIPWAELGV